MEASISGLTKIVNYVKEKFKWRNYGCTFWTSIVVGLLAHGFVFTNKLVVSDEINYLFQKGATMTSGRWFIPVLSAIFPDFSMPWIYGVITIVLFAFSACVIVKIFDIKNTVLKGLTGALIVSFPSLTGVFGYMFTSTSYGVGFLLMTLGFLLIKDKFSYKTVIGIICLTLSMGIYQAYIAVAASFAIMYLIKLIIDNKEKTKDIIYRTIGLIVSFFVSGGVYFAVMKLILLVTKTDLNGYATSMVSGAESLKGKIICVFSYYFKDLFSGEYCLAPNIFLKILYALSMLFLLIFTVMWLLKKADAFKKLFLVLLIALYPASVNCLIVLFKIESLHTLTKFSYVTLFLLVIVFIERMLIDENTSFIWICREISSVTLVFVVAANIYIANEAYLDLKLRYENVYSYFTQVTTQIKMQPEYRKDMKIAIIGKDERNRNFYTNFGNINRISGINSFTQNTTQKEKFINYYIGFDCDFVSDEEEKKLSKTEEFNQMPTYPDYGSIKCIDDCIVVKLGECE